MTAPVEFIEPWNAVVPGEGVFAAELRREAAPGHVLYGRAVRAVARRQDRDDVLFELTDSGGYAVVHLTWTGQPEAPPYPTTRTYESISTAMGGERTGFGSSE